MQMQRGWAGCAPIPSARGPPATPFRAGGPHAGVSSAGQASPLHGSRSRVGGHGGVSLASTRGGFPLLGCGVQGCQEASAMEPLARGLGRPECGI